MPESYFVIQKRFQLLHANELSEVELLKPVRNPAFLLQSPSAAEASVTIFPNLRFVSGFYRGGAGLVAATAYGRLN